MDSNLDSLIDGCARLYRVGREAEAAALMENVIIQFTKTIEGDPTLLTPELQRAVANSLSYQESQDWIGLADELQYALKPSMRQTAQQ